MILESSYIPKIDNIIIDNAEKDNEVFDMSMNATKSMKRIKQSDSTRSIKVDINLENRQDNTLDKNIDNKINLSIENIKKITSKKVKEPLNRDIFDDQGNLDSFYILQQIYNLSKMIYETCLMLVKVICIIH